MKRIPGQRSTSDHSAPGNRRGTILVMFMLSLILLTLTIGALVRVMLTQRDIVRSEHLRVQTEWLFQSAVVRAAAQLKSNAEYSGEEWNIPAESLGQPQGAIAEISVTTPDDQTNKRLVAITVNYPPDEARRAQVSRTVPISL